MVSKSLELKIKNRIETKNGTLMPKLDQRITDSQ